MRTTGEEIFQMQARLMLADMGMRHLDPAHGAAVDIVRWCLTGRRRPTHHRQVFLEQESPAILAYLEKLTASGDAAGWRTLEERIRLRAEILVETDMQPCRRPWLAAIWHTLPELAAIGQTFLDRRDEPKSVADFEVAPTDTDAKAGDGGDDKGSAGKAGSVGTTAKPKPSPRLALPVVTVVLTEAEMKALDLRDDADAKNDSTSDGPEGPTGPKPGGKK